MRRLRVTSRPHDARVRTGAPVRAAARGPVPMVLTALVLGGCTPVAIPPPGATETEQQQQERLDRERYQARIHVVAGDPQAISGFLRIGRVYSERLGSGMTVSQAGNARDLDMIIDVVNEYTQIDAGFTPAMPYSDPLLYDLPIVVPQGEPNEAELEALARYLMSGGFALTAGLGHETIREGLEKYGGLVWGRDAWMEDLPADHPLYSAFFEVGNARPTTLESQARNRGVFIGDRLVSFDFAALGQRQERLRDGEISVPREMPQGDLSPAALQQQAQLLEGAVSARRESLRDLRFERMVVNTVVYALTQPGSIAMGGADGGAR